MRRSLNRRGGRERRKGGCYMLGMTFEILTSSLELGRGSMQGFPSHHTPPTETGISGLRSLGLLATQMAP